MDEEVKKYWLNKDAWTGIEVACFLCGHRPFENKGFLDTPFIPCDKPFLFHPGSISDHLATLFVSWDRPVTETEHPDYNPALVTEWDYFLESKLTKPNTVLLENMPESAFPVYPMELEIWIKEVLFLLHQAVEKGDLPVKPRLHQAVYSWSFKPKDIIKWASRQQFPHFLFKLDAGVGSNNKKSSDKQHGNTIRNAKIRGEVLDAAREIKTKYPEECKNYTKWAYTIEQKAGLFWQSGNPPLETSTIARLLSERANSDVE